jgi:HKD family nuclease
MHQQDIIEIHKGLQKAYIDNAVNSNLAYSPQFITNDYKRGVKILTHIENQLMHCDEFSISVAFINRSGFVELAETLKELERRGIRGRILTTDYLCFSEPYALDKLASLTNIQLKIYHVKDKNNGFHTKGYLFRENGIYRIIIGSANMTQTALSTNMEWNTQLVSTEQGEMAKSIVQEFERLWKDELSKSYDEFIEDYRKIYNRKKQIERLIREQHKIALQNDIVDYDTYNLKPNKMQEEFIGNIHDLRERGATRALLISATGTGKTYASAFALKNEKPKKALFIVHREIIAKQAIKSYQKVFGNTKKLALLSGSSKEYEADILFATMSMMAKQETLNRYKPGEFEWICIDDERVIIRTKLEKPSKIKGLALI